MDKPLVKITWIDASDPPTQETSWFSDAEVDKFSEEACVVVSVGYLKSKTALYYTLVGDYILNEDQTTYTWGRPTKIPVGMVQLVEDLSD